MARIITIRGKQGKKKVKIAEATRAVRSPSTLVIACRRNWTGSLMLRERFIG